MKGIKFLSLAAIFVFGAMAGIAQGSLGGVRWELTQLNGKQIRGPRVYIEFNEAEKRFGGNAGCNRMFGSYELNGTRFKTSGAGTTRMACMKPGLMETESAFLKALGDATRLRKRGANLRLYTGNRLVARFRAGKVSETPQSGGDLTSMKWMLRSIDGKPIRLNKHAPFLNFDAEKKSAGGNSGCNLFGGNYEVEGSSIKFSQMISTMRACEFENRMTIERDFLEGLQNADRYEIKNGKLLIYRRSDLRLEFEGQ